METVNFNALNLMRRVILYSMDKANLKCTILTLQLVKFSLKNISILLILYFYPINIIILCISGYDGSFCLSVNMNIICG